MVTYGSQAIREDEGSIYIGFTPSARHVGRGRTEIDLNPCIISRDMLRETLDRAEKENLQVQLIGHVIVTE